MIPQFAVPTCICAPGASLEIGNLVKSAGRSSVFCVYDPGVKAAGIVDPIVNALKESGLEVFEFGDVVPDPSVEAVAKAGQAICDCKADCVVAIGGGSAMDTAKLSAIWATNGGPTQKYYNHAPIPNALPMLIAVPTTSGTGSEVTCAAVVSDYELGSKVTLVNPKLVPTYAVLDPNLVLGLPAKVTAATGMDALAHAIECMTCVLHGPLTDGIALSAIHLIVQNLKTCVEDGKNLEARTNMMVAATIAGMAFGNSGAHVGHALAHAIGAVWHIPHGAACAHTLPYAVRNCAPVAGRQLAEIAKVIGLDDAAQLPPAELAEALATWLEEFAVSVGIPSLVEMGATADDLDTIVACAQREGMLRLSGVPVSEEECRAFYAAKLSV